MVGTQAQTIENRKPIRQTVEIWRKIPPTPKLQNHRTFQFTQRDPASKNETHYYIIPWHGTRTTTHRSRYHYLALRCTVLRCVALCCTMLRFKIFLTSHFTSLAPRNARERQGTPRNAVSLNFEALGSTCYMLPNCEVVELEDGTGTSLVRWCPL